MTKVGKALITGASSGIGAVYADRLARRGYDLILVARRADRLAALAEKLAVETGRRVDTLVADLGDPAGIVSVEKVLKEDSSITLLVNNAGVASTGEFLGYDPATVEKMIGLNVAALTRLTLAAAPGFVARGSGTIINVGSVTALAPELLSGGVYASTKAYVLAFSQAMQSELGPKGITVQAVLPGATATDFWADSGIPLETLPREIVMSSEDLVDAALSGLDQGELITIPPLADAEQWNSYDAARRAFDGKLSAKHPADRYRVVA